MGEAPCNLLEVELALDRVEAQLAVELPVHMRAFARAYATGTPAPAAPDLAGRASTASIGRRALAHPELAERGIALLRVVAPIVIERDAGVSAARAAAPTWATYEALVAARDAVANARFGRPARSVLQLLHGADDPDPAELPGPLEGWSADEDRAFDVDEIWRTLVERHRVPGELTIVRAEVRPRAFVVVPGREVHVVVPPRATSRAARFAVMHELGHGVGNLLVGGGLPRVLDEAVASLIARDLEHAVPIATRARARRVQLARALAAVERGEVSGTAIAGVPPWALWHDPAAQAAYVAAEVIADRLAVAPDLGRAVADERARIDRATVI
ncbi:MAG: hypothetical protein IPQ07_04600 [Myxococcales bacterium]|nr:hypothetical protein [Myxococcales bacterium]